MRYFLEVSYDGTAFHGSQVQGDLPTVQSAVNKALSTILRKPVSSFGASRTDEGVHALCNFYHFDEEESLPLQLQYKLNAILPHTIAVNNMYIAANPEFNARFDAVSRRYRYRIYTTKNPFLHNRALYYPFALNKEILSQTAAAISDYSDFETFSKRNTQSRTFRCNILSSYWEEVKGELHYIVEANRFLRGMVRGLVGTQLNIARGKNDLQGFRQIVESKDCTLADFSVAGHGLYLEKITYPEDALKLWPGSHDI